MKHYERKLKSNNFSVLPDRYSHEDESILGSEQGFKFTDLKNTFTNLPRPFRICISDVHNTFYTPMRFETPLKDLKYNSAISFVGDFVYNYIKNVLMYLHDMLIFPINMMLSYTIYHQFVEHFVRLVSGSYGNEIFWNLPHVKGKLWETILNVIAWFLVVPLELASYAVEVLLGASFVAISPFTILISMIINSNIDFSSPPPSAKIDIKTHEAFSNFVYTLVGVEECCDVEDDHTLQLNVNKIKEFYVNPPQKMVETDTASLTEFDDIMQADKIEVDSCDRFLSALGKNIEENKENPLTMLFLEFYQDRSKDTHDLDTEIEAFKNAMSTMFSSHLDFSEQIEQTEQTEQTDEGKGTWVDEEDQKTQGVQTWITKPEKKEDEEQLTPKRLSPKSSEQILPGNWSMSPSAQEKINKDNKESGGDEDLHLTKSLVN